MKNGKQWTKNAKTKQNCGAVTTVITQVFANWTDLTLEELLLSMGPNSRGKYFSLQFPDYGSWQNSMTDVFGFTVAFLYTKLYEFGWNTFPNIKHANEKPHNTKSWWGCLNINHPIISQILDSIYWVVTIFILMVCDSDSVNQQLIISRCVRQVQANSKSSGPG